MKQEAFEVLKNRRAIRSYKADQVPADLLDAVLEAGTYAPTGMGLQSPVIVAVQDPETVAQLDKLNASMLPDPSQIPHPYYGAPTILLVFAPDDAFTGSTDAICVGTNLINAAYAAGLGSCWIHRSTEMFQSEEGKALLAKWGLPENLVAYCSIALGFADGEVPQAPPRKDDYIVKIL